MTKLINTANTSLDGYVADENGNFDWTEPDAESHSYINDLERPIGTYLYGRRMYEVMRYWQDPPEAGERPAYIRDYAEIWQAADKVVYSRTLDGPLTPRTEVLDEFDPGAVREMKEAADADLSVSGPHLTAEALRAGLVDELRQFVHPVIVGGGTAWLPDDLRLDLELLDEHRFSSGVVYLRYGAKP
jgi:dihydrofolate reductase